MHLIYFGRGYRRSLIDMNFDTPYEGTYLGYPEKLINNINCKSYGPKDFIVICENRAQIILRILQAIPADFLPARVVILTKYPTNKWLIVRIPPYLIEKTVLTTEPENVGIIRKNLLKDGLAN